MSPVGLGTMNHCADDSQQRFSSKLFRPYGQIRHDLKAPRPVRQNMVLNPVGLGTMNHCADDSQQQFSSKLLKPSGQTRYDLKAPRAVRQ
jgi:hypothetical protein